MFRLEGLTVAPFTPFKENGELDLERIDKYIQLLADDGISNAFVNGTNGEGPSMSSSERKLAAEAWVKYNKGRLKSIMVMIGGGGIGEVKDLAAHAEKIGANAVSALPPMFFKPKNVDDVAEFLKEAASACPNTPFFFYYNDSLHDDFGDLEDLFAAIEKINIPNFCGAKMTSNNTFMYGRCLRRFGHIYQIGFARDQSLLPALSVGGDTFIGGSYNYLGRVALAVIDAFNKGDLKTAQEKFAQQVAVINVFRKHGGGGVEGNKALTGLLRVDLGPPRLPLRKLPKEKVEAMRKDLEDIGAFEWINKSSAINN